MSVSFSCDRCGAAISQPELDARRALFVSGKHFCADCKGPIIELIKKRKAAAAGSTESPAAAPPAAKGASPLARRAAKESRKVARRSGAAPAARPSAPGRPKAPGRPPAPGRAKPPAPGRAKPPAPGTSKAPAPGHAKPLPGGKSKAGRGERVKPPVAGRGRAGAPSRAKPGHGKRDATTSGRRRGRHDEDLDERRNTKLYAIGGTIGAAVVVVVSYVLFFSGGDASSTPSAPEIASKPAASENDAASVRSAAEEEARALAEVEANQRKALAKYKKRFEEARGDADGLSALLNDLHFFGRAGLIADIGTEAAKLSVEANQRRDELAREIFDGAIEKSKALQAEQSYGEAYQLWLDPPRIIDDVPSLANEWTNERKSAEEYAAAARYWAKLAEKAKQYRRQGDYDIAIEIVRSNVPEEWDRKFPPIWEETRSFLELLSNEESADDALVSQVAEKQKEARRLARYYELEKIRKVKWDNLLEVIEWVPLLSPTGDLENWYKSVDYAVIDHGGDPFPWKNIEIDGKRLLSADASEREDALFIGMNGDHWLDWVFECEVQVLQGDLDLEARTLLAGSRGFPQKSADEKLNLSAEDSTDWREVRLEVRGNLVRFLVDGEEVKIDRNVQHRRGGFRFELKPTGVAKIRSPRIKWVNTVEPGDDGSSEFADPE